MRFLEEEFGAGGDAGIDRGGGDIEMGDQPQAVQAGAQHALCAGAVDHAVRALRLGAAGYVSKQSAADVLVAATRRILSGGRYVSPALAELLAGTVSGHVASETHESLSNRELQVLKMIAMGKTLKEIGVELALSEKTVATYRARISEKMGLPTNVDLTRYAMRHGLVD